MPVSTMVLKLLFRMFVSKVCICIYFKSPMSVLCDRVDYNTRPIFTDRISSLTLYLSLLYLITIFFQSTNTTTPKLGSLSYPISTYHPYTILQLLYLYLVPRFLCKSCFINICFTSTLSLPGCKLIHRLIMFHFPPLSFKN